MKITHLEIKNKEYKNLNIDLKENKSHIMAFIGNNGSGKSNLLESLSIIFYYLHYKKEKNIPFNFSITFTNSGSSEKITITKNKTSVITNIGGKIVSDPYNYLPKQIVAIYSGEEDRMWKKWYFPIYKDYI
ncbi:AAA family ATPase, partial [Empedobacter sp. GD03739]|uniref:AAA family ATPase n=1 Tax=Empedobacter sp. GD03739 TaxID=2975376 RepID=UPI00244AD43C